MRRLRAGESSLISCSLSFGRKQSLKELVENIMLIKEKVKEKLRLLGTPGSWDHITDQNGPQSYLGLNCKCLGGYSFPFMTIELYLSIKLHGPGDQSPALPQSLILS